MKILKPLLALILLLPLALSAQEDDIEELDIKKPRPQLALSEVPPVALAAARREQPDVFFNAAKTVVWRDERVYVISGVKGREAWNIFVTLQGEVLRVESDVRD